MGDRLLCSVGRPVRRRVRRRCSVARLGGDEFAIAIASGPMTRLTAFGAEVRRRCSSEPIPLDGLLLPATGSVGAACYPA